MSTTTLTTADYYREHARAEGFADLARELVARWRDGVVERTEAEIIDAFELALTAEPSVIHVEHHGNHVGYACGLSGPHCWACNEPWPCRASRSQP